ncbi:hypothetical protein OG215_25300 [Streptomyces globisporus]|uniref:hypothetical protein n=1 Tax=Streptomyces globisporus TaxID=1908 RepID=UPI003869CA55|nr:hypothetical protein OG215_25300 [Streptomyces globisporus]
MTTISLPAIRLAGFHSTNEVAATSLPVDLPTNTWRTILRVVAPVAAGDLLDVSAWFKVTNDIRPVAYPVGVGAHLWAYDVDDGKGAARTADDWWRLDPEAGSVGMNVHRDLHHLVLPVEVAYQVPGDWPPGHRMVIALRADAHSTAWDKDGDGLAEDRLTVDPYGRLTVRRYCPA